MPIELLLAENSLGQSITLWTVRVSLVFYVASISLLLLDENKKRTTFQKITWTVACAVYVVHVVCAFQFYHHWSHNEAYRHTADRTRDVIGIHWGGGIYFNYFFTLLWVRDVLLQWFRPLDYLNRDRYLHFVTHGIIVFIAFNATVVFATGPIRWFGIIASAWLIGLCVWRVRRQGWR